MSKTFDLLFIDDEAKAGDLFARFCTGRPYRPHVFQRPQEALAYFRDNGADLVITDLRMPGMDGIELLHQIRQRDCDVPAIVITAYSTVNSAINALRLGAVDFLKKPFDMEELLAQVDRTLSHTLLEHEVRLLRRQLKQERGQRALIGESRAMREVYRVVERIADVRCNVVIEGESGTGKELLAKAIHELSSSPETPLVIVDCGAITETLLESELFGHEKGAFTGASHTKRGLLESADGGTVFLDEIGNISEAMQVKLLRVIQEGQLTRVGGVRAIDIDVRWLVATNRDLEQMVRDGEFREDLYHRLNVVKLVMPPLRERPRDVPALVQHFVAYFSDKYQRSVQGFDSASMERLMGYRWPGNVRELRNLVERHVVLADSPAMELGDLPGASMMPSQIDSDWPSLDELERRYILRVLDRADGNQREVAEILGIDKSTLWRKLKRYRNAEIGLDEAQPEP
ncbi:MAG: sigma-54-dependent Fis family transcriptional regulator [Gammaproteobacteria bacterium]|nr:sigma-54-dependent Fis family transcriptional regulator [Gammaproteobacteria bacterium]MCP5298537.1 sigma-54-dependent Fis family transcriptional regulator [Chromatiaceae bacterium]